jgi:hypothetical protein
VGWAGGRWRGSEKEKKRREFRHVSFEIIKMLTTGHKRRKATLPQIR